MAYKPREIPGAPDEDNHSSEYDSKNNRGADNEYHRDVYNVLKEDKEINQDYTSSKKGDEKESIEERFGEGGKEKYKKEDETEEGTKKADDEIHNSISQDREEYRNKKTKSTIEDAINRAMEE